MINTRTAKLIEQRLCWQSFWQAVEEGIEFSAIRASGAGGQHVNKASTAVQLRLDLSGIELCESRRQRAISALGQRVTEEQIVVLKAQSYRSQKANKDEAIARLKQIFLSIWLEPKVRKATKPSKSALRRKAEAKARRSVLKASRRKPVV